MNIENQKKEFMEKIREMPPEKLIEIVSSINRKPAEKKINLKRVKCAYCSYSWVTKSEMIYTKCPNCNRKTRIKGYRDTVCRKCGYTRFKKSRLTGEWYCKKCNTKRW